MQKNKIVLDLETQKSFDEVGGRKMHLLRVSVVGVYSYLNDKYAAFEEKEIPELEKILKSADLIIGFNIKGFDLPVLEPYFSISIHNLPVLDIMEEVVRVTGHRVSLNSVAQATLGKVKSGSGLDAVRFYREGEMEKLKRYCLNDVQITKEIYDYGQRYAKLSFTSKYGRSKRSISISWGIEKR